jgi:catechol 2,3-dioxygenase-like lactoylglutathione lyase family enzyme
MAHLARCGVAVEREPAETTSTFAPGRHVYFRDPDGSLLELVSYE